jgi:hypothetical protein
VSIDTIDKEQRNVLRRIYREIEGRRADAWRSTDRLPSSTDGAPSSTKPLEASPVAREALERLLAGREFTVVLKSLPDFAQP